ncbi:MAG: hypothetical protein QOH63_3636 [Acidobacteriota bacterium]|jgi:hypothetical protein|nr:hypothetical protein [Acidobacteriota bacterium]
MSKPLDRVYLITSNIVPPLILVGIVITIILDQIGIRLDDRVYRYTLFIIISLVVIELIKKNHELKRVEADINKGFERVTASIDKGFDQTLTSLGGVLVTVLSTPEEAYEYMAYQLSKCESTIYQASISPAMPRWPNAAVRYENEFDNALKKRGVSYRYVALLVDKARVNRIKRLALDTQIKSFFAGVYEPTRCDIPMIGYIIFDEREIVIHHPLQFGEGYKWIAISHPKVLKMFLGYFSHVWEQSLKVNQDLIVSGELDRLAGEMTT